MKKVDMVVRNFMLDGKRFITSNELKSVCKKFGFSYETAKKLLLNKGFLVTIFRGFFYMKDFNEKRTGVIKYTPYELLAKGIGMKGIKNWYFGLNTALKLLNLTHEFFTISYVVNDKFNRVEPMKIYKEDFKFVRIKSGLFFGIKEVKTNNNMILRYSDLEKTILDMAYLYKKSGKPESIINSLMTEFSDLIDRKRFLNYSKHYPKSVRRLIPWK